MAAELLIQDAAGSSLSPIVFGVTASLNPADDATNWTDDIGTDTADVALTFNAMGADAAQQSLKADLGAVRAPEYMLMLSVDFTGETITTPGTIDCYWAPSTSGTQASSNVAGNSGADAVAPDGALGTITKAEFLKQCVFIGSLVLHDGASVQCGPVGVLRPTTRYGQLVIDNQCDMPLEATDVEGHAALYPIVPESQ